MNANDMIWALMPTLSSKAKKELSSKKRSEAFLFSFLLSKGVKAPNPAYQFLNSKEAVDRRIEEEKKKKAEEQIRGIGGRLQIFFDSLNKSNNHIFMSQQGENGVDMQSVINYILNGEEIIGYDGSSSPLLPLPAPPANT